LVARLVAAVVAPNSITAKFIPAPKPPLASRDEILSTLPCQQLYLLIPSPAYIARVCAAVAVRTSHIAIRDVTIRDVAVLRPQCPWSDFVNALSNTYDSTVTVAAVFPHESFVHSGISAM
jgi:hypothetical protein